jgi:hypothetical protein
MSTTKFTFVNSCNNEPEGFRHRSVLLENGAEISKGIVHWCNRSWESFPFQKAQQAAVKKAIAKKAANVTELETLLKTLGD